MSLISNRRFIINYYVDDLLVFVVIVVVSVMLCSLLVHKIEYSCCCIILFLSYRKHRNFKMIQRIHFASGMTLILLETSRRHMKLVQFQFWILHLEKTFRLSLNAAVLVYMVCNGHGEAYICITYSTYIIEFV